MLKEVCNINAVLKWHETVVIWYVILVKGTTYFDQLKHMSKANYKCITKVQANPIKMCCTSMIFL